MKRAFWFLMLPCLLLALGLTSCGNDDDDDSNDDSDEPIVTEFTLQSSSFAAGAAIPVVHACPTHGGDDVSPNLSWSNAPQGTNRFALIMDDETPPCGTGDDACRHWMVYNIPADTTNLSEGLDVLSIAGATEGMSYVGIIGYAGPCPPPADNHTYRFTVYALKDTMPIVEAGTALTRSQFEATYGEHILASATLSGTFAP